MCNPDNLYRVLMSEQPLPETIRAMIIDAGATQAEAAAALQVSYATMRGWLSGKTRMPRPVWLLLQKVGLPAVIEEYRAKCQRIRQAVTQSAA